MNTNGRAFLFLESDRRVYRCQLTKAVTLIGSGKENDIVINDGSVVGRHAQISCADNTYSLRPVECIDLKVDGHDVDGVWTLDNGQVIRIGDLEILFAREQKESSTAVHLIVRSPNTPPMGFWTCKSTVVIGREKGDLILDDPLLTRVHAVIENFCEHGQFLLDARSERGTSLNGEIIDSRRRLKNGDIIEVGSVEIEFRSQPFDSTTGRDASSLLDEYRRNLAQLRAKPPIMERVAQRERAVPRSVTDQSRLGLVKSDPKPAATVDTAPRANLRLVGFGNRPSEMDTRLDKYPGRGGLWYLPRGESNAVRVSSAEDMPIIKAEHRERPDHPIVSTVQWNRSAKERQGAPMGDTQQAIRRAPAAPLDEKERNPSAHPQSEDRWYMPQEHSPSESKQSRRGQLPWYRSKSRDDDGYEGKDALAELDEHSKSGNTQSINND
jgi:pSer/pThr/pTyr-binding forkhead associated (FHA) protein